MEDSDATNWAADGGEATFREKRTASYPFRFGRQALYIDDNASADQGAKSNAVTVAGVESVTLNAFIKVENGSMYVTLWDNTNSTALKSVTVTEEVPVIVSFTEALSSTTEEVYVRVRSAETGSKFYVGPVFLTSGSRSRYAVDTGSVEREGDIEGVYSLPLGASVETDVYLPYESLVEVDFDTERDDRANILNIITPRTSRPLFMKVAKRHAELALDTDTTYADREMVVQGVMAEIEEMRADRATSREDRARHRENARRYRHTYYYLRDNDDQFVKVIERPPDRTAVAM
jgi:hypothetical protein